MTSPAGNITPTACPRCRSGEIRTLGKSPVAAVWTIFGCPTCFYAWRSSEPEENVNPDKYPAAFRLRPDGLADLKTVPPVPPRAMAYPRRAVAELGERDDATDSRSDPG